MQPDSLDKKYRQLVALYQRLPTEEIRQRIDSGSLVPLALQAATAELERRTQLSTTSSQTDTKDEGTQRSNALLFAVVSALALAVSWFVLSPEHFWFAATLALPAVAIPFGKQFPRLGLAIGIGFAVIPIPLVVWLWNSAGLSFSRGGMDIVVGSVIGVMLLFALAMCWAIAASLIFGARHRGSWAELNQDLDRRREEQIKSLRR